MYAFHNMPCHWINNTVEDNWSGKNNPEFLNMQLIFTPENATMGTWNAHCISKPTRLPWDVHAFLP